MIRLYEPYLAGREREFLIEAFDSTWISSSGQYIEKFEIALAEFIGAPFTSAVTNGTVALHLAMHCLDLREGDEVIVPSFTYIASVNTIVQAGAMPVFVDCNADDWLINTDKIEEAITSRTRAIMAVHLYGAVCDMKVISSIAERYGLYVIEDCAEALGSTYHGKQAGTFGNVSTYSFFGNKTITTGEGGLVATSDRDLHSRMRITKGQGQDPERRYWHTMLGFNYRMTNLAAAIGVAQMENINDILSRKRNIADRYRKRLSDRVTFQKLRPGVVSSNWLVTFLVPDNCNRDKLMAELEARDVETRPVFYCAHQMPPHIRPNLDLPVSQNISRRGISVPSHPALTDSHVDTICEKLISSMQHLQG